MRIPFLILLILLLFETKAQFSQLCFLSPNTHTITNAGNESVSADFNGDNKPDLAIAAGGNGSTVSILINMGNGVFATPVDYSVGVTPVSIVSGDFNNDGKIDLATANYNPGTSSILLGTGNGTFSTPITVAAGSDVTDLVTADFNSDGKADLAFSCQNANNVYVSLGNGSGSFSSGTYYPAGSAPVSITKGDFNNDGKPDLAVANSNSSRASVLLNTGTSFAPVVDYILYSSLFFNIHSIASSDFNGDGHTDLVITSSPPSGNSPYGAGIILLGSSTGTFIAGGGFATGANPHKVMVADFNADGKSDIATANDMNITILIGNGNVTFTSPGFYPMTSFDIPTSMTASDFNSDGKLDLVCTTTGNLFLSLVGNGDGTFISPKSYPIGVNPNGITSADFNNDGNIDIAAVNSNSVSIALGTPTGTFPPVTNFIPSGLTSMNIIKTADFNNDGKSDLLTTKSFNVSVLLGIGTGSFSAPINTNIGANLGTIDSFTLNDLNNDGIIDLAYGSSSNIYVKLGIGNGSFSNTVSYTLTNSMASSITSNDFNGDGILDLAFTMNTSTDKICIMYGTGAGLFGSPIYFGGSAIGGSIISSDFNNDGKSDIITYDYTSNMAVILASGTNTFSPPTNYYIGSTGKVFTSDITGDGKLDLILGASLIPGLGNGIFGPAVGFTTYGGAAVNLVADFNNDGKLDLAGIAQSSFFFTVVLNDSPNFILSATNSVCVGSSAVITATGGSNYTWSTGGTGNSITVNPTTTTTYTVVNTSLSGCASSKTISVIVNNTCQDVWPGDANSDGVADNLDVLELGLHFTQIGSSRATTSNLWQSYFSNNWSGTITNGKNINHSDCNGDGTIDNNDTLAIYNNYNLTHAFKTAETNTISSQLSVTPDQTIVNKGEWGTASIYLGDNTTPINTINGLAYTINFTNTLIETDSIYIEYLTSFLNSNNQNLNFNKRIFSNGVIFTATTYTNNSNVSGNGKIATLHYKINPSLTTDQILNIDLVQTHKSDASGVIMPLTSGSGTLIAKGTFVGLQELVANNLVSINPNPTNGLLNIHSKTEIQRIVITSITGNTLLNEIPTSNDYVIHLDNFSNGIYFVNVYQNNHIIKREKVIVNR